jgi:hypothetical protein
MDAAKLEALLAQLMAKLEVIMTLNHQVLRELQRLSTPVDLVDTEEAARRAGVSVRTLVRLTAMQVFTDGRPPEKRGTKAPRRYYADEVNLYRTEGEDGVRRFQEEQGRREPATQPRRRHRASPSR